MIGTRKGLGQIPPALYDRFSALPNELLVHILSFLTMDEAVASGALSKRWEYLWTQIPNLVYVRTNKKNRDYDSFSKRSLKFIGETLNLHSCTRIETFMVKFLCSVYSHGYTDYSYIDYFDTWVKFALKNRAKELSFISVPEDGKPKKKFRLNSLYTLSRKLCTTPFLTKLELCMCKFAPNSSIYWNFLRNLSLRYVELQESMLQQIQLGSPKLEYLELNNFIGLREINIISPSIKKLVLRYYHSKNFQNCSSLKVSCPNVSWLKILGVFEGELQLTDAKFQLVEANLDFSTSLQYEDCHKMVQNLLRSLCNVGKLSIGSWFLKVLSTMQDNHLLCPPSQCKSLTLNVSTGIKREDLFGIVCILESLPNLEALTIVMSFDKPESQRLKKSNRDIFPKLKGSLNCLQQHLKTVRVVNFVEKAQESELLEYLLENAEKLEKMTIQVSSDVEMIESFKLTKKLLSFPRASRAMILFSEGH